MSQAQAMSNPTPDLTTPSQPPILLISLDGDDENLFQPL